LINKSKNIAIALPYAVSIRDFIHSGTLAELIKDEECNLVVYTINPDLPEFTAIRSLGVEIRALQIHNDSKLEKIIKSIYPLFFSDKFNYVRQMLQNRSLYRFCSEGFVKLRCILGTRFTLNAWSNLLLFVYKFRALPTQLDENFDLLIGTRSLINSLDYGLIAEAALRGIPILMIAGSWDNFTTKGYFPFPVLKTVVWNQKMREELIELFSVPERLIICAGYPRANLLRNHARASNANDYLNELNLKGYSRFVLYSASYSELTRVPSYSIPLEYMAIREVCKVLVQQLPEDTCVIIRLHPFSLHEDESCFEGLEKCFVFVPGRQDLYVERVMDEADERHLALQISQSVCIISMASTMSIDAMCLGKPIINVAFDPVTGLSPQHSIRRFYDYNHFRDLVRIARLPIANQLTDVIVFVSDCLAGQHRSSIDQIAFERMYVPEISNQYPQRVCAAVKEAIKS
jgi:hypothetical protein